MTGPCIDEKRLEESESALDLADIDFVDADFLLLMGIALTVTDAIARTTAQLMATMVVECDRT